MNYLSNLLINSLDKKRSLTGFKLQFVSSTILTVFGTILFLGVILGTITVYNANESINSKGEAVAQFISKVAPVYIKNYDLTTLESFVLELQKNPEVVYIAFFDKDKKVLVENKKGGMDVSGLMYLVYGSKIIGTDNVDIGEFKIAYKKDALFIKFAWSIFWVILSISLSLFVIGSKVYKIADKVGDDLELVTTLLHQSVLVLSKSSTEVNILSNKLDASSTETDSTLQSTMGSIEDIEAITSQTSKKLEYCLKKGMDSQKEASEGLIIVQQFEQAMASVFDSNKKLVVIRDVVEQIETETKVIDEIVFKTKLLSFNANIEAERAGSYGNCFAVVANQVGKLAKASGSEAEEITGFLIKSKTLVADTIAETGKKADFGQRISVICRELFEQIMLNIKELTNLVSKISNTTEEQTTGIRQTSSAVNSLSKFSNQNIHLAKQAQKIAEFLEDHVVSLQTSITSLEKIVCGKHGKTTQSDDNAAEKIRFIS